MTDTSVSHDVIVEYPDIIFYGFLQSSTRLTIHRYLGLFVTGIAFHYINPPVVAYIPQFNILLTLSTAYSKLSTTSNSVTPKVCSCVPTVLYSIVALYEPSGNLVTDGKKCKKPKGKDRDETPQKSDAECYKHGHEWRFLL